MSMNGSAVEEQVEKARAAGGEDFLELGTTGLVQYSGQIAEEMRPALQGDRATATWREMSEEDPTIGGSLITIDNLVRRVHWHFEPPPDTGAEGQRWADHMDSCLDDMSMSWADTVSSIFTMVPYGWCMPPDQTVLRGDGSSVPIGDIVAGDEVLTGQGRARKVTNVFRRRHSGTLVSLRMLGYPFPVRMTAEHMVPTSAGWKPAGDIEPGDELLRPRPQMTPGGDFLSGWVVGFFLAEGHRDRGGRTRVTFSIHAKEVPAVAERINSWLAREDAPAHHLASGRASTLVRRETEGRVSASHPALADLIDHWVAASPAGVGAGARAKQLLRLPTEEEFARGIWEGWLEGDAGATVSEALGHQMHLIGGALGFPAPLRYHKGGHPVTIRGEARVSPAFFDVGHQTERWLMRKRTPEAEASARAMAVSGMSHAAIGEALGLSQTCISKWLRTDGPKQHGNQCRVYQQAIGQRVLAVEIEDYDGEVFDLEVDEDHTFCAGNFAVSNSYHNPVLKRRQGEQPYKPNDPDAAPSSDYDDGLVGWRGIYPRSQDSKLRWEFGPRGNVLGMWQQVQGGPAVLIPIERGALFRTSSKKNSPEGVSALRSCHRPWYFLRRIEEHEGIGIERDLAGLPVAYVPPRMLSSKATPDEKAAIAAIKRMVSNVRRNANEGMVFPRDLDEKGNDRYGFELLTSGSKRQIDIGATIMRKRTEIALCLLTDWLLLGHEGVGSRALGAARIDNFNSALETWTQGVAGVFDSHITPRVMRANGVSAKLTPKLRPGRVQQVDMEEFAGAWAQLVSSGAITNTEATEQWAREQVGAPGIEADEWQQAQSGLIVPAESREAA